MEKQRKAYFYIYEIENKLRVAMHNLLVKKIGSNYFTSANFPPFAYILIRKDHLDIVNSAVTRKNKEKIYNLNLKYDYPLLWYLDYSILVAALDYFWDKYFHELFREPIKIKIDIINRLVNLAPCRNAIAHNRYLSIIDFNDLESLYLILGSSIKKELLINYDNLALNIIEALYEKVTKEIDSLILILDTNLTVDDNKLNILISDISAISSTSQNASLNSIISEIFQILNKYNQLPRKPGHYSIIRKYIDNSDILLKLEHLKKELRS
jgi:hypothetical protein